MKFGNLVTVVLVIVCYGYQVFGKSGIPSLTECGLMGKQSKSICYTHSVLYQDCAKLIQSPEIESTYNGKYTVATKYDPPGCKEVYCDMTVEGGGWTVFQRRGDGAENFNRNWKEYKEGFGDVCGEFWLGNEYLHEMTDSDRGPYTLRIEMESFDGESSWVEYQNFTIGSESENYKLKVGKSRGPMLRNPFCFKGKNGLKFSTSDNGTDAKCAIKNGGGWWWSNSKQCSLCVLNSIYSNGGYGRDKIIWYPFKLDKSLRKTTMMLRPSQMIRTDYEVMLTELTKQKSDSVKKGIDKIDRPKSGHAEFINNNNNNNSTTDTVKKSQNNNDEIDNNNQNINKNVNPPESTGNNDNKGKSTDNKDNASGSTYDNIYTHKATDKKSTITAKKNNSDNKVKTPTPKSTSNKVNTPKSTSNKVNTPKSTSNKVNTPKSTSNTVNTPKSTSNKVNTPKSTSNKVNTPKSISKKVNTPNSTDNEVNTPKSTDKKVNTPTPKSTNNKVNTPKSKDNKVNTPKSVDKKKNSARPIKAVKRSKWMLSMVWDLITNG